MGCVEEPVLRSQRARCAITVALDCEESPASQVTSAYI